MSVKVQNFVGNSGQAVANQFNIDMKTKRVFQSYETIIAEINKKTGVVTLDKVYWDYSRTTGKYRNMFLGETKAETQRKIDSKEYRLRNLNK